MLKQIHAEAMNTFRKPFFVGKNLLIFLQISIDDLIQIMMQPIELIQIFQINNEIKRCKRFLKNYIVP